MTNLKSEILFNRSLLWIAIAELDMLCGADRWVTIMAALCAVGNLWKSYKAWEA